MGTESAIAELVDLFLEEASRRSGLDFDRPKLRYDLRGLRAGQADTTQWTLRFNVDLLEREGFDAVYETVGHEIAHLVADTVNNTNCGHDLRWKEVMVGFGLAPNRCHSYVTARPIRSSRIQRRYIYSCRCGTPHILSARCHNNLRGGQCAYVCSACKTTLSYAGARSMLIMS